MTAPGERWSQLGFPPIEPWQPPTDRDRPSSWPKTGTAGASTNLAPDEEPTTVPARPYAEIRRNGGQHPDRLAQLLDASARAVHQARTSFLARAIGWFRR